MMADDKGLYFLTAKGKSFYERLAATPNISLTGMKGEDTMSSQSVTVRGKVRELGGELLPKLFELNPYMADIYPDDKSRTALTVFQIYEGKGEFFDLSIKPIFRQSFTFGGAVQAETGYHVADACIGCKLCYSVCPQRCIDISAMLRQVEHAHDDVPSVCYKHHGYHGLEHPLSFMGVVVAKNRKVKKNKSPRIFLASFLF